MASNPHRTHARVRSFRAFRRKRLGRCTVGLGVFAAALGVFAAPAWSQIELPVASTFDLDAEGWTLVAGEIGNVESIATGGSPGGFVQFTDLPGVSSGHLVAPPRFHGDWSALDGVASLSWQHQIINPGGGPTIGQLVAFISGPGGTARFDSGQLGQVGNWVSVAAPISATSWVVETGNWAAILADVTELRIRIEVVSNAAAGANEVAGIDNVVLADGTAGTLALPLIEPFDASLEGWALAPGEIGSVTHSATGGHPGGLALFVDGVGASSGNLVAPAAWRGNWLGPDGPDVLAWEHLILDPGGLPTIATLQAHITGPGGSARYDSGVLASTAGWVGVEAPIVESEWIVTAGTWNDLLANVTDVRIAIEGASNGGAGDTSAIDNIELRAAAPVPMFGAFAVWVLLTLMSACAMAAAGSRSRCD